MKGDIGIRTTIMKHLNKYFRRGFLLFTAIMLSTNVATATASQIAVETWAEVIAAVDRMNPEGGGTIRLASRSVFYVAKPLPKIIGEFVIEGNGARIEARPYYHGALIQIDAAGSLELKDVNITGFDRDTRGAPETFPALIDNHGELNLKRVTLSENACVRCSQTLPLLINRRLASLHNVTIYNNNTRSNRNFYNCGTIRIMSSTIAGNYATEQYGITGHHRNVAAGISNYYRDCGTGIIVFGNTLMANGGGNCEVEEVFDLGGNFDSDDSCGFDPEMNVVNQPAGLARFGMQGGLVPTVGLEPGSHAIDAGVNEICSATDARMASRPVQVRLGTEPRCDSGAFEYAGSFGNADLSVNGMNGLWYNAETDGHYVHVIRVSPDRVYVNWSAFDQNAEQLWLFAVATTTESSSFSATAYVSVGGQLI